MDTKTKKKIEKKGWMAGIFTYVFTNPENERVTIFDKMVTVLSRLTMFLILLGVFITFYEVVLRYLFGSPTLWVNEITLWLGSIIYLASGAYSMQRRAHIRITAVYDICGPKVRLFFEYIAVFVLVVYAVLMLVGGYDAAWEALSSWERFGTVFDPPIPATIKPLVLAVTLLVAIGALNNLLVDWYGRGRKNPDWSDRDQQSIDSNSESEPAVKERDSE